jgi:putative spermidine/putrescine transport system permease protein
MKLPQRSVLLMWPALLAVALLLGLPLCVVVVASFGQSATSGGPMTFSLANYSDFFSDSYYPTILLRTFLLSLAVTAITVVLGWVMAMKMWYCTPRTRGVLMLIVIAPLLVSVVARTYGWLLVLGERGFVNQFLLHAGLIDQPLKLLYNNAAVVFGLSHLLVAFPALSIHASLERIDKSIFEAAYIAGASPWRVFRTILLPMTAPGMAVGAVFSFSLAMSAFVTPELMGGKQSVLATMVYQKFMVSYDWNFGACLALFLLMGSLLGTALITALITGPYRQRIAALRMST